MSEAKAVTTPDLLRDLYLTGIAAEMGRALFWGLLSADQQNAVKAFRDVVSRDDDVLAKLFAQFQKEQAMALDHKKMTAALSPFGIDFGKLYADLTTAFIADVEKTAADMLAIVQAALNGAPSCPKMATAGGIVDWAALFAALKANFATVAPLLLQILLSLLAKQPVPVP